MKKIFCVYDNKSTVFANPFVSQNTATALRDFQTAATDPQSNLSQYPEDFILFEIGSFDEDKGVVSPILPINLGSADQFTFRG
ncbi:MAG: nonstructural protein [Microviridae sp.]|nr:MAG: nonstructural protein [Microviridae sp.]